MMETAFKTLHLKNEIFSHAFSEWIFIKFQTFQQNEKEMSQKVE